MSQSLHQLIHSLSKQEKRYFKIYNSTFSSNDSLTDIFDVLSQMDCYNEEKLKERLRDNRALKYLSVSKNKLYHAILESLTSYHQSHSIYLKARQISNKIEMLSRKNLYDQALDMLGKLEKLAANHELPLVMTEVIQWYRYLWVMTNYKDVTEENLLVLEEKMNQWTQSLENQMRWRIRSSRVFRLFYQSGLTGFLLEKEKAANILHLREDQLPTDRIAQFTIYNTWGVIAGQQNDYPQACEYLQQAIKSIDSNRGIPAHLWNDYISAYNNLIISLAQTGQRRKAERYITKLEELGNTSPNLSKEGRTYLLKHLLALQIFYVLHFGTFDKVEELLQRIAQALKSYNFTPWHQAYFHFSIAYIYLIIGHPSLTINWINRLLSIKMHSLPADVLRFGRLLEVMGHYQLQHYRLFPNLATNHQRYLKGMPIVFKVEQLALSTMKKAANLPDKKQRKVLFQNEWPQLLKLLQIPEEKRALEYIDFDIWWQALAEGSTLLYTFQQAKQKAAHG